ncbi:glycosyltransferase family 61 protein [Flavisolibacter sp. BT320]|nr:glycosyltransferase family 61 protein [Flavisolibacter longurius]
MQLKNYLFAFVPYKQIRKLKKYGTLKFLLWGKAKRQFGHYLLQEADPVLNLHKMETSLGNEVVTGFTACHNAYIACKDLLREYVLVCQNCIIEPKYGWGIDVATDTLIFDSIANNSWLETYHPGYFQYKKSKEKADFYPDIISIRMLKGGERNYWHFLHDLLGEVVLAKEYVHNAANIPYLISEDLAKQPFFKQAIAESSYLSGLNWVVQKKDQYVRADKAYFLQVQPNKKETLLGVRALFNLPLADNTHKRKVFLTRNPKRIRYLKNAGEIEIIARKYSFEIIDADTLSFSEQINLFRQVRFLAGIHGAGLVNMIFRQGAPMSLLELFPQNYIQPHYFWLSKDLGFDYACLVGSKAGTDTAFSVAPAEFEDKIQEMLNAEHANTSISVDTMNYKS